MGIGLGVLDLAGLQFVIPGLHSGFWLALHVGYGIVHRRWTVFRVLILLLVVNRSKLWPGSGAGRLSITKKTRRFLRYFSLLSLVDLDALVGLWGWEDSPVGSKAIQAWSYILLTDHELAVSLASCMITTAVNRQPET